MRGFGIHSPFAFDFILRTIRENAQYYAYPAIRNQRIALKRAGFRHLMSERHLRLLFRIVNRFQPTDVLLMGALSGEETAPLLEVSENISVNVLHGKYPDVLEKRYKARIKEISQTSRIHDFIIVNKPVKDADKIILSAIGSGDCIIIFPRITEAETLRLWNLASLSMKRGMTFHNDSNFGIIINHMRLPRQNFRIWM